MPLELAELVEKWSEWLKKVDGKSGCGAGQGGLVGREQGLSCAVCGGVEVVLDVAGEIER